MPAHQQAHPEHVFQGMDLAAHRGLGQAQVMGSQGDAHAAAHRHEAANQIKGRKPDKRD